MEDRDEEERQRKEREKQERIEQSLRERSKEVKEQMSKIKSETEKERDQLKRDEALECFRALLIDLIKPNTTAAAAETSKSTTSANESTTTTANTTESGENAAASSSKDGDNDGKHRHHHHHKSSGGGELSWKEAKKILKKDPRWSMCKLVEKERKEQLFDEHMAKFRAKKRELFHQLLNDTAGIVLKVTTWKEAKKLIKADPRYEKLANSTSDAFKLEKEYDAFMNEKSQKARDDFRVSYIFILLTRYI